MSGIPVVWIAGAAAATALVVVCGVVLWIAARRARGSMPADTIRTRLAEAENDAAILEGLERLSKAPNRKNWADIVSSTLAEITGTSGGAVVLRAPGTDSMSLAGSSVPLVIRNLEGTLREPHGPSRRALSSAQPVTMSAGELPAWAAAAGYETGVVLPIEFHGASIGLAYALGKPWQVPASDAVAIAQRFISLSTSHYCVAGPFANPASLVVSAPQPARRPASSQAPASPAPALPSPVPVASTWSSRPAAALPVQAERRRIDLPGVVLDPSTDRCIIDGRAVALSRTEFELLYVLASSRGDVVSPERLLRAVWGSASIAPSSALDVTIHRVRKKLGRAPGGTDLVRTVRGRGYAIAVPDPISSAPRASGSPAAAG